MIKKHDFIWTIGFQGNTAIVNKRQRTESRDITPSVLLAEGMLRAAFSSALWEQEIESKATALEDFRLLFVKATGLDIGLDNIKRMLGVYQVPRENLTVLAL